MNRLEIEKITEVAENLDWIISFDDNDIELNIASPAGQDFYIHVFANNIDEFANELYERYTCFDCSTETYLWLDSEGHGVNGAPSDMKDVYEDMQACEEMLEDLAIAMRQIKEI